MSLKERKYFNSHYKSKGYLVVCLIEEMGYKVAFFIYVKMAVNVQFFEYFV